jgi:hypothetical protein
VSHWKPCARPRAKLTAVDPVEITETDGRTTQMYRTDNNVRFIRITEPSGFTFWMQEVKS